MSAVPVIVVAALTATICSQALLRQPKITSPGVRSILTRVSTARSVVSIGKAALRLSDAHITIAPGNRGRRVVFPLQITNSGSTSFTFLGTDQELTTKQRHTYTAAAVKIRVLAGATVQVTMTFTIPEGAVPTSLTLKLGGTTRHVALTASVSTPRHP